MSIEESKSPGEMYEGMYSKLQHAKRSRETDNETLVGEAIERQLQVFDVLSRKQAPSLQNLLKLDDAELDYLYPYIEQEDVFEDHSRNGIINRAYGKAIEGVGAYLELFTKLHPNSEADLFKRRRAASQEAWDLGDPEGKEDEWRQALAAIIEKYNLPSGESLFEGLTGSVFAYPWPFPAFGLTRYSIEVDYINGKIPVLKEQESGVVGLDTRGKWPGSSRDLTKQEVQEFITLVDNLIVDVRLMRQMTKDKSKIFNETQKDVIRRAIERDDRAIVSFWKHLPFEEKDNSYGRRISKLLKDRD